MRAASISRGSAGVEAQIWKTPSPGGEGPRGINQCPQVTMQDAGPAVCPVSSGGTEKAAELVGLQTTLEHGLRGTDTP